MKAFKFLCYRKDVTQRSYDIILISAINNESAIAKLETDYPKHRWFVIEEVRE